MASGLGKDLIYVILQFLNEEKYRETARMLEKESGVFFNMKHFEELVMGGKWDEAEKYLSGFTKMEDNRHSMKIFFEIRKQKYLEALDRQDKGIAVDFLQTDLKVFSALNEVLYKELAQLVVLNNIRENPQLTNYGDSRTARAIMLVEIKKLIEANPLFSIDKLVFPEMKSKRLHMLINHSLNWQHSLCANPLPNPEMKTILVDHHCRSPNDQYGTQLNLSNQHHGFQPRAEGLTPMFASGIFQPMPAPVQTPLSSWMAATPSSSSHPVSGAGIVLSGLTNTSMAAVSRGAGDFASMSRARPSAAVDRTMMPGPSHSQNPGLTLNTSDDLPKIVARTLNVGSFPTSMDFHPIQQTLLLVGTDVGDISLWEVSSREKLASRNFQLRDITSSSMTLKAALIKDPFVSVRRILWSPDGSFFGVAYSKHLVHLYAYFGGNDIRLHLEIDSHTGSVNDIAFSKPNKQLFFISCGADKTIKVWDIATGAQLHKFEGHEAAVHSLCPHNKDNVHFIFSTSVDGKIKAWLYDTAGSRVDYFAPGCSCSTMIYSADGKRLFSCGTSKEGETHLVEWNENEGIVKRTYQGFTKRSLGLVQFDTSKNRYLAAGDDYLVKFWDMENPIPLATTDAEGGLTATPRIRFNKEGSLLAVSANENRIKILATVDGLLLIRTYESLTVSASRGASEIPTKNGDSINLQDVKGKGIAEGNPTKAWKPTEINAPARFHSLKLSAHIKTDKISRLIYNNSGNAILALASNAIHLLWRWSRNDLNTSGKATTKVAPQLMQPASGLVMTNDLTDCKQDEAVPCFAVSKNDSYVVSASGGKVSLFNMTTFKTMTSFMPPPPAATSLAFHPQDNNIIAIGLADSTICIYNVRVDGVKNKLSGHSKRITGLAFSQLLNTLVSSGADAQIIVWDSEKWIKQRGCFLFPPGRKCAASETNVQFHHDQKQLLVINEAQLSIYDIRKLECLRQWIVEESSAPISHATFSCDSQFVYCSFLDGTIRIFAAPNLQLQCQINPAAYLPSGISSSVYPLAVAAHPQDPNQFAIGLVDGSVHILEPPETEGKWGVPPPLEISSTSRTPPPAAAPDQMQTD
ncbi:hypothetical protein SLE2022_185910 [Rubroshorea leprosula]